MELNLLSATYHPLGGSSWSLISAVSYIQLDICGINLQWLGRYVWEIVECLKSLIMWSSGLNLCDIYLKVLSLKVDKSPCVTLQLYQPHIRFYLFFHYFRFILRCLPVQRLEGSVYLMEVYIVSTARRNGIFVFVDLVIVLTRYCIKAPCLLAQRKTLLTWGLQWVLQMSNKDITLTSFKSFPFEFSLSYWKKLIYFNSRASFSYLRFTKR